MSPNTAARMAKMAELDARAKRGRVIARPPPPAVRLARDVFRSASPSDRAAAKREHAERDEKTEFDRVVREALANSAEEP